jgi:hypothetical protein
MDLSNLAINSCKWSFFLAREDSSSLMNINLEELFIRFILVAQVGHFISSFRVFRRDFSLFRYTSLSSIAFNSFNMLFLAFREDS